LIGLKECGLMLEPQQGMSVSEIVHWARYAETMGYGYIMRSDHLLPTSGAKELSSPECWTTLGLIAGLTRRIRFGPLVSPVGFRNPALLARMASTLGSYSEGRLILGIGAGWFEDEYLAHGIEFPGVDVRIRQLHEALEIILPLIRGKPVDHNGEFFRTHLTLLPRPREVMRLIVGGRHSHIIRLAGEYADELNMFLPNDNALAKAARIMGEIPRLIPIIYSWMGPFIVAYDKEHLYERISSYAKKRKIDGSPDTVLKLLKERGVLCGTKDDFLNQLGTLLTKGFKRFYFQLIDPSDREMVDCLTDFLKM
jgi:alkanesulfonate monooxygenase SsuD/methylene tetrahydromethanopterin reductase-like flavin-dependent oxidoreductase (luciferase family)